MERKRSFRPNRHNPGIEKNQGAFFSTHSPQNAEASPFFASSRTTKAVQPKTFSSGSGRETYEQQTGTIQPKSLATPLEDEKIGTAEQRMEEDKMVQEKSAGAVNNSLTSGFSAKVEASGGKGALLPSGTRKAMESSFGADFSQVNIHTGPEAVQMNRQLNSQAFTHGTDVFFNAGKYSPHTMAGKHLLAHELTHVMQQEKGSLDRKVQAQFYPPLPIFGPMCRPSARGSARPGPGISISYQGRNVQVNANLEVHGPAASAAIADQMKQTIERLWTGSFTDGYAIQTSVNIRYRGPGEPSNANATQIRVFNTPGVSLGRVTHMWGPGNRTMEYNLAGTDINWSPAHEFGHLLGLRDKYSQTWSSWFKGMVCPEEMCPREIEPDQGYENNIMGVDGGRLESKNIQDLIAEHQNYICEPPNPNILGETPPTA